MDVLLGAFFFCLQSIIVLLLGINIKATNATSRDFMKISGEIGKLTVWMKNQEKLADERDAKQTQEFRDVWDHINKLKTKSVDEN